MQTTNGRVVLRDLADLAQFAHLVVREARTATDAQDPSRDEAHHDHTMTEDAVPSLVPDGAFSEDDVAPLAAAIERVIGDLRVVAEADARVRERATSALGRYRQLEAAAQGLDQAVRAAEDAATQAGALATGGLADEHRRQAEWVREAARSLGATARARLAAAQVQLDELSARPDVQRLLEEERRVTAAAAQEADRHRREAALRQGLDQVQALLAEGNENEARRLLGVLGKDHPNSPDLASLTHTLDRRARLVKERAAERTLGQARGLARRAPGEAVALLGAVDLDGVPDPLARQVYGCWLAACRRLAPAGARHYSPRFGQGAVLVPGEDGRLEVLAVIGLPHWMPGQRFALAALRGARRL